MAKKYKIREGPGSGARFTAESIIPRDAEKLPFSTKSYEFYFHRKKDKTAIYINTISYHPGQLEIPLGKLEETIKYIKDYYLSRPSA